MSFCRTGLYVALAANFALSAQGLAQVDVATVAKNITPDPLEGLRTAAARPTSDNAPQFGSSPDARNASVPVANEHSDNPLWPIPLKSLSSTRDRPLFTPSRRPPAPPAPNVEPVPTMVVSPPAAPQSPRLELIGLVAGKRNRVAVFVDEVTREVVRLRPNEGHDGWILRSIDGRAAILEKRPFTAILRLPAAGGEQKLEIFPEPATISQAAPKN
jgi:general secretion pathway protein N